MKKGTTAEDIRVKTDMHVWEILVPTVMNGKLVRVSHHRKWDAYVRGLARGLTILKAAKGQWIHTHSNTLIEERMIPVRIIAQKKDIERIVRFTLAHYQQHTTIVYQVGIEIMTVAIEAKSFAERVKRFRKDHRYLCIKEYYNSRAEHVEADVVHVGEVYTYNTRNICYMHFTREDDTQVLVGSQAAFTIFREVVYG